MNQKIGALIGLALAAIGATASTSSCKGDETTSSSSSSTSTSSGAGGACSTTACSAPSDCPATSNECIEATCEQGCCGTAPKADGTPLATQTAGNCAKEICASGKPDGSQPDDTDAPADLDDCHTGACDASHAPTQTPKPTATACSSNGGTVCGDTAGPLAGKCVECVSTTECTPPSVCDPVNHSGVCVDPTCTDGIQDNDETDKDCGGSCGKCPVGLHCGVDTDCASGFCDGGVCALRQPGAVCSANDQCLSNLCDVAGQGHCCSAACDTTDAICGATGCDDTGACVYPASATSCSSATCNGATLEPSSTCDGAGSCVSSAPVDCTASGKLCDPTLGCVQCLVDADCGPCGHCSGSTCSAVGFNQSTALCASPKACNGQGMAAANCSTTDGSVGSICGNNTNCLSHSCVNWICQ